MNRVRIVDLPGLEVEPGVKGKSAFDLLSAEALAQLIRGRAQALRIDADAPDLIRAFDGCFVAGDDGMRAAANAIAAQYGRYLAYLLLTLKRGDAANRAARVEWESRHWAYWAGIDVVWLGGGLVAGNLRRSMLAQARATLAKSGYPQYRLNLSVHPDVLPLLGAGRYALPGAQASLLFDFGHSYVKRAYGFYEQGRLLGVRRLQDLASPCLEVQAATEADSTLAQQAAAMIEVIVATLAEAEQAQGTQPLPVIASLACYLHDGHPYPSEMGCYGRLQQLGDNLQVYLAARLGESAGRPVDLRIVHDGTAAATVYAGEEKTAVLTLGTAIGIGFPPAAAGLRPLATPVEVLS